MLNAIRKRASSWFVRAFFLVLVASFAVWGVGDMFLGGGASQVAATVGESEITVTEVANAFQSNVEQLQNRLGTAVDREQAVRLGVMDQALEQLVTQRLLDLAAADLGLTVANETLRQAVLSNPAFQTGGQFDRNRFENVLRASGLSEEQFLALLRRDALRAALLESLAAPVAVPETLVDQLYRHRNERRGGQLLVVAPADVREVPRPTEEELAAYHEAHAAEFTAPEYRRLTFVTLEPEDIVEEVQVGEEELREEYELRLDEFTTPERRTVKQLLSSDEEAIRAAADWAGQAGADFATVAESNPKVSFTDLGEVERGELPAGLEEVAFGLAAGEISKPVRSAFGWHLFRVEEVLPERVVPFEEAREELRRQLAEQRAIDELPALGNALDDELAAGLPLEEAAANVGLEVQTAEAVDARGLTPEDEPAAGLPAWPEFLQTAFSTEPGEPTLLHETADGAYFVLRVDEVTPPRQRPLDEVRDEVAAAWEAERRRELARERAEELLAQAAEAGRPLDELAAAAGLTIRNIQPIRRIDSGAQQGLNPEVIGALFDTEPGHVANRVVPVGDGFAVVATNEVLPADPAADAEGVERLRAELAADMRDDLLSQYEAALRARHPVDINAQALSTLL